MVRNSLMLYVVVGVASILTVTWLSLLLRVDRMWNKSGVNNQILRSIIRQSEKAGPLQVDMDELRTKIGETALAVHKARIHARGTKTSDALRLAAFHLDSLLNAVQIDRDSLLKRHEAPSSNICPEVYKGSKYGYPFFYTGFEETGCEFGKPLKDLVTMIAIDGANSENKILTSTMNVYPSLPVILATHRKEHFSIFAQKHPSVSFVLDDGSSHGDLFNKMAKNVKTPYVLVGRMVDFITNDSRLTRLVRELEGLGVAVSGGAWRDPTGHWTHGCYQSVYRNYTLKYVHGYDESMHECIFCDYITGPFLARKKLLIHYPFKKYDFSGGLMEEWFLRIKTSGNKETIVCPDSMFHLNKESSKPNFKEFMTDWSLYKFQAVNGRTFIRKCEIMPKDFQVTKCLSPCKAWYNAKIVKLIMATCKQSGIICELQEGTSLGAVKFGKTLPWERDGDITFLSANHTALAKLASFFSDHGYRLDDLNSLWCCADNRTAGGKFTLVGHGWRIELYGQHIMDSELLKLNGIEPTQVLLDGQWVNVPRNPGLFVRNRYGREIYQHALHWMSTGASSGWEPYKTNVFPKCSDPGDHDCLDRFNADGSLSFEYILP